MIYRLVRGVRVFRIVSERKQVEISLRQKISQNKRRYQQDGYDLDLTYVTKRVIATSFPSTGVWALYRNPIGESSNPKVVSITSETRFLLASARQKPVGHSQMLLPHVTTLPLCAALLCYLCYTLRDLLFCGK